MVQARLDGDIRFLKGVGEKRSEAFKRLGAATPRELLGLYPRAYEDRTTVKKISELALGEVSLVAATVTAPVSTSYVRSGLTLSRVVVSDGTGLARLVFFNRPYLSRAIKVGVRYLFWGKVNRTGATPELHPTDFTPLAEGEEPTGAILPIYPLSSGLTRKAVAAAVASSLELLEREGVTDPLPDGLVLEQRLARYSFAIENIHRPLSFENLDLARRRLIFDELFYMSLGLIMLKGRREGKAGRVFPKISLSEFEQRLGFSFTAAQRRAAEDCAADLCSGSIMNRLVQGDVGSGKTAVAAFAALQCALSGAQAAIMAPTEILARQHAQKLAPIFESYGIKTVLLTGKMPARAKREALAAVADGSAGLVVGTHAVISNSAEFASLGLVVCDEQHRFGVRQRAALSAKGRDTHMLVLSATPIPRTLSLIMFGDLDLSVIDERPPGRKPIKTYAVDESYRSRIEEFVKKQAAEGHQSYIVCPMIDENDEEEHRSVTAYARSLAEGAYRELRVGILHGRLRPEQKEAVTTAFASGELDLLVSTTVVEVGVDNPNATLMVIESAERFGLSQLHQLRGRVGRGDAESFCILVNSGGGSVGAERLRVLCKSEDGFEIARRDLELRGPGDFFGSRQSGLPGLKLASLASDMELLSSATAAAKKLLCEDRELTLEKHRGIKEKIAEIFDTETKGNTFN